ncbi:response regulator [Paenibacillus antri]|uniref:Response regulator n=1 Tax=Paenibacillus antri TaxID=2582848 RepID=A0A5R9GJJ6_9BACL|nr:response regulator [Paenibacillus antri]TLS51805.1 response regulator [Paenibacillus antri]
MAMQRMIIVDDELSTRTGLRDYIDWASYGIQVVGEAADGEGGLALYRELLPDIVITDIKMPKLDGIAFAKRLRESDADVKIVFVSGYDDVDYLKSAMKMDAVDYILKPIDRKELGAVFGKIAKLADSEKRQRELMRQMTAKLHQSVPLLKEKFLHRLITERELTRAELEGQIAFLELRLPLEAEYCVCVLAIDDRQFLLERMPQKEIELISFSIQNICQESIDQFTNGYVFEYRRFMFAAILGFREESEVEALYENLVGLKAKLDDFLTRFLQISISIGVGNPVHEPGLVHRSFDQAEDALQQKLFLGKNRLIRIDQLVSPDAFDYKDVREELDKLEAILKAAEIGSIQRFLEELTERLSRRRNAPIQYCRMIFQDIVALSSRFLAGIHAWTPEQEALEVKVRDDVARLETIAEMNAAIGSYMQAVAQCINEKKTKKSRNVIERIKSLIESRYNENLTIAQIAEEVYLTTTYVCLIFKQETGYTLNEYMTKVRMDRAIDLLKDSSIRLYDICYAIGYSEPGYFSKQFKRYTGLSPSEFRNMHGTSEPEG